MFWKIFSFELRYRLGRPATYLYFAILFLFAFLNVIYGGGPSSEKAFVNSAYAISSLLIVLSIFSMLISSAVMGMPVYRDIEHQTHTYFFSYPIREKTYLMGRFWGSFVVLVLISLGIHVGFALGAALGPYLGLEDSERFGQFNLMAYIVPTLIFTIPNLFFTGTIFFALVALTRRVFITYVGSIFLLIAYILGVTLAQDIEYKNVVDILDPFAFNTFDNAARYWTPVEQNTLLPSLTGNLFWNRLLWVGVSLVIFAYVILRFRFADFLATRSGRAVADSALEVKHTFVPIPKVSPTFSTGLAFRQMVQLARLELGNIIRDPYFLAILVGGVLFLFLDGWFGSPVYGTPSLPLTYYMLEVKDFNYGLFVFILIIFYTGETVHRDKTVHFSQIIDALPVPNWVQYGSKFLSLAGICFLLATTVWIVGVINQTFQGYFNYEFGMYFMDLYLITFPNYLQLLMLAFIVHILVNNKFVGHVVTIGIWLLMVGIRNIGEINYNLFFYSYLPDYRISDMNGFGHFFAPLFWFNFYWLSLGVVFLLLGNIFWNRGTESSFRSRFRLARQRLNRPVGLGLVVFMLLFLGSGAFIYYNVSVLNPYRSAKEQRRFSAEYEKKYKKYERLAQPKVTDVKVWVDIYPNERATDARGRVPGAKQNPGSHPGVAPEYGQPDLSHLYPGF
ncbi:MAG: hypothetical protein HC880_06565 [Bacteroidia bacterium]|nr:hypothetical protein [Bacteroidia bacterium]